METSGQSRRAFAALGHEVISVDLLPSEDDSEFHIVGDVFEVLEMLADEGWWPDLAIFHPDCTYHALAGAWAFKDADFERYPGVGYHQRVLPGTPVGAARRLEREMAELDVERIAALPILMKAMENPKGTIPTRTSLGRPQQVVHPWQFGDDASKATCLWLWNLPLLRIDPRLRVPGRMVTHNGKMVERWANQTDSGQNNVTPDVDRWKDRSRTYDGICNAFAVNWGHLKPARVRRTLELL